MMKIKVYLIMLLTAGMFTSCFLENANKKGDQQEEPETVAPENQEQVDNEENHPKKRETPQVIKDFKAAFGVKLAQKGFKCTGSEIRGNDVVFSIELDESDMPGNSLKKAVEETGYNARVFAMMMAEKLRPDNPEEEAALTALRAYEYNVVFRMVGNETGEEVIAPIPYDQLPL